MRSASPPTPRSLAGKTLNGHNSAGSGATKKLPTTKMIRIQFSIQISVLIFAETRTYEIPRHGELTAVTMCIFHPPHPYGNKVSLSFGNF